MYKSILHIFVQTCFMFANAIWTASFAILIFHEVVSQYQCQKIHALFYVKFETLKKQWCNKYQCVWLHLEALWFLGFRQTIFGSIQGFGKNDDDDDDDEDDDDDDDDDEDELFLWYGWPTKGV